MPSVPEPTGSNPLSGNVSGETQQKINSHLSTGSCSSLWPRTVGCCTGRTPTRPAANCTTFTTPLAASGNWPTRFVAPSMPTCGILYRWCSPPWAAPRAARNWAYPPWGRSYGGVRVQVPYSALRERVPSRWSTRRTLPMTICSPLSGRWRSSSRTRPVARSIIAIWAPRSLVPSTNRCWNSTRP